MSLHALLYCERLFYLEEIEEIRVADWAVYAGRRLHDDVVPLEDETPERRSRQPRDRPSRKMSTFISDARGHQCAYPKKNAWWVSRTHPQRRR